MRPAIIPIAIILALLLCASGCTQQAPSAPSAVPPTTGPATTKEAMVAFVKEAVAYAHTHGKVAALAEFSNRNGSFFRGDLYIYAYDFNGTTIAHPVNPEKIAVNRLDEKDALGNYFIRELRDAALNGSGFVEYYYINPVHNNAVEKKLGYVEKAGDDWWLGSGIYFGRPGPSATPAGNAPVTSQQIKDYVDNAAGYALKNGKTAAIAAFNNRTGPFVTGDVYIYALDYGGNALALPFQPELVGTNFSGKKDPDGKPYTDIEIKLVKSGGGYLLYRYPDPAANLVSRLKISYVRPVDDTYWIGAGIYTSEDRLIDQPLRQFVADAKAYAWAYGREKAVAEFNNVNGQFISGDLYIFAYDYNGTVLAWPYQPGEIGKNRFNVTDPMGTHHIRAMIEAARNGGGMVDYYSVNPFTNTTQLKISYIADVDGTYLLGAGRYLEPGPLVLSP
ncbi:MAG: Cache domain protein [Methanoregula sp. PtaU1.Bin051]|nr:MAG: Cache domain protein [Methanoregula sp. PtaU1.Bin051]